MIITTTMLIDRLSGYANPRNKISRMASSGELIPIRRGLFETDAHAPAHCLAGSVYGPSYLSFEYALSHWGLIPEGVSAYTSATCGKRRSKRYDTAFGTYTYRDVPLRAFRFSLALVEEGAYAYWIASAEKALCDMLYTCAPVGSQRRLSALLGEDLRIEEECLLALDKDLVHQLALRYHSTNITLLAEYVRSLA